MGWVKNAVTAVEAGLVVLSVAPSLVPESDCRGVCRVEVRREEDDHEDDLHQIQGKLERQASVTTSAMDPGTEP